MGMQLRFYIASLTLSRRWRDWDNNCVLHVLLFDIPPNVHLITLIASMGVLRTQLLLHPVTLSVLPRLPLIYLGQLEMLYDLRGNLVHSLLLFWHLHLHHMSLGMGRLFTLFHLVEILYVPLGKLARASVLPT